MNRRCFASGFALLALCALTCASSGGACAQQLTLTPFDASGVYDLGETAGWTVTPLPGASAAADGGGVAYTLKKNNLDVLQAGKLDFSAGAARIEAVLKEPAMLYLTVTPSPQASDEADAEPGASRQEPAGPLVAGAAVAPAKLQPVAPRPADFDAFWAAQIDRLHAVDASAVLTPGDSGRAGVDYATIVMDHVDGEHVYGQLAKPAREGKFPALVILQWASPPYPLQKAWVVDRAAQGWLVINIEPHNVPGDKPQAFYDALPDSLKHYESIGNDDRDHSYFLRMYLADYRAVDYIAGRPDWDGKTLVVLGTSMGGQQSLCVAGLHPQVTHVIVNEPAGCDTNGPLHGRQASYPNFPADNPQVMQTALYFDAINFAPHIKAKSLVAMGFLDTVAAPAGIWTAFNQIPGPKEAAPMIDSPHNHLATPEQQRPFTQRYEQWLDELVHGRDVTPRPLPAESPAAADHPVPRTDPNSRLAHEQLLAKARSGGIDAYFLGDSITRRWGCTDPQYADLLANWNANFFGWNAANFGWGGDTTQNILWRLGAGELAGVNPKVIVIQAGTNNLDPRRAEEAQVPDVVRGIRAIVATCRRDAPDATIILTAVFPRSDHASLLPTIRSINAQLAALADGTKLRLLDVNNRLTDADGNLLPGMMHDGLHPTVAGYQVWADGLKPLLTEILGPPAATDHAPPPTGDPSLR